MLPVPNVVLDISSSWVERSLHAKFQLPRLPRSGSSMVGDKNKTTNSVELEATLAPAEAEVGAVAKADQYKNFWLWMHGNERKKLLATDQKMEIMG